MDRTWLVIPQQAYEGVSSVACPIPSLTEQQPAFPKTPLTCDKCHLSAPK